MSCGYSRETINMLTRCNSVMPQKDRLELLLPSGPTVLKILAAAVTSARILSALVAAVRHIARSTTRERDPQGQAGAFNTVGLSLIRARLPRHAQHRALPACPALDPSNENFWIAATQIDSGSTTIKEKAVDLTTVIINPPVVEVSNSGVVPVAPLTLHPPRLEPSSPVRRKMTTIFSGILHAILWPGEMTKQSAGDWRLLRTFWLAKSAPSFVETFAPQMADRVPGCVEERSLSSGAFSAVHQEYEYTPAGHSSQCEEEDAPGSENKVRPK
ncbi:hypothetical protein C8J57DRAFT_1557971 [Mycena rebaudengoi]|nr:hypothetical protein C8J57DRAFT_1557971 [Mycena rebaudengoi]